MIKWIKTVIREKTEEVIRRGVSSVTLGDTTLQKFTAQFKTCETCGCLIHPSSAVKGNLEIRQGLVSGKVGLQDYIYTPYYCKVHAPKVESDYTSSTATYTDYAKNMEIWQLKEQICKKDETIQKQSICIADLEKKLKDCVSKKKGKK